MKRINFSFCALLAAGILLAGCVTQEAPRQKMAMGVPHGKVKYKKIKADGLELRCFGRNVVRAGRPANLTFALKNNSNRMVRIPEWFSHESDNLMIFIQPWISGMVEPDEQKWIRLDFDYKMPIFHYPITLMPGNQVLVSKELGVVEKLIVRPGDERRFFIRAALTLESLPLVSDVSVLTVTANYQNEQVNKSAR